MPGGSQSTRRWRIPSFSRIWSQSSPLAWGEACCRKAELAVQLSIIPPRPTPATSLIKLLRSDSRDTKRYAKVTSM